jgi:3-oxoacyl-[acyl-carrier protein] reductase
MLKGKTAIITGGARGIGAAIATTFAQNGANIVVNGRSASDALEETASALRRMGATVLTSVGDVSEAGYAAELANEAAKAFGGIDILVNNAGIIKDSSLVFMKEEDWDDVIATNLGGAFHCSKAVIKHMMKKRWGRIVNVSSITALSGRPGQCNYGAAKAGLIGFTRSLAREVGSYNVLVNAAVVGVVDTRMTRQIPRETLKEISEIVPLGRVGRPEEVANACLFFASEMSSYVTGTTLNVSGGGYI